MTEATPATPLDGEATAEPIREGGFVERLNFSVKSIPFRIYRPTNAMIHGTRDDSAWRKWWHRHGHILTAVLYLVSLAEYDVAHLDPDDETEHPHDLQLTQFQMAVNSKPVCKKDVFLLFTKKARVSTWHLARTPSPSTLLSPQDLFETKLQSTPLQRWDPLAPDSANLHEVHPICAQPRARRTQLIGVRACPPTSLSALTSSSNAS